MEGRRRRDRPFQGGGTGAPLIGRHRLFLGQAVDDDADEEHEHGAEREEEARRIRKFLCLPELANNIVNGGDMIRVDGVTKPESISEQSRSEQQRLMSERDDGPGPGP